MSGSKDNVNTTGAENEPRDLGFGILFKTDLFEFILPRVDFNVTRLLFKDESKFFNRFSANIIASHGLVYTDSKIYAQQDEGVNLIYEKSKGRRGNIGKTTEAVTSYGLGLSYIINDRFDIGVESTIRNVWNDVLDAWGSEGSANDKYSFTSVGITYHLRKRKEVVRTGDVVPDELAAVVGEVENEAEVAVENESEVEKEAVKEKDVVLEKEAVVERVEEEAKVEEAVVVPVIKEKKEEVAAEIPEKIEIVANKLTVDDFKNDVIKFELNSNKETSALNNQVKSIAEKLKNSPSTKITLGGYTDRSGSTAFNKVLSIQRAKWVKDQLVGKYDISNDRITVVGYGETGTTEGYDPNSRKVEVVEVR